MTISPTPVSATGPVPAVRRRSHLTRRLAALGAAGAVGIAAGACGGSSVASTTQPATAPSSGAKTPSSVPGASGTIAAVNGATLEVQNAQTGQVAVTYSPTTVIRQTTTATVAAVTVGSCISAFGTPASTSSSGATAGGPITATTVSVSQPTNGTCARGGFGGRPGGTPGSGSRPAGGFGGGGGTRPGGGSFGAASGQVTAMSATTLTVDEVNPQTQKTTSATVTLTGTTVFTTTGTGTASAIVVGQCARAARTADQTGTIAATSLTILAPTNGTCTTGFGFRGGAGAAGASTGA
jgi:hypothetical protein